MKSVHLTPRLALVLVCAAALLVGVPFAAHAYSNVSVQFNIGNAPPAPYYRFYAAPRQVYLENSVYLVEAPAFGGDDCFRYEGYYWVFRDGYWYRAPSLRGRFVVVSPRYVPTVIYDVPAQHWHHHPYGPPARVTSYYGRSYEPPSYESGRERESYGGSPRGHAKGHGGGHGHEGRGNGNGKGHGNEGHDGKGGGHGGD